MGLVLEPDEAETLLAQDERHRDVIFPYLNGEDLNSHPEQKPSRYVINFFDWPLERTRRGSWWSAMPEPERKKVKREGIVPEDYPGPVAADYPDILAIVKERVYPVRAKVNRKAHRKYWWHYGDKRPLLYATIAPLQRVLVIAEVSKYIALAFIPGNIVFSHMTVVFAADDWTDYAVLQSSFHDVWARQYSSSMGGTLRYTLQTFSSDYHSGLWRCEIERSSSDLPRAPPPGDAGLGKASPPRTTASTTRTKARTTSPACAPCTRR